jgi:NhaA family Na+:H+ antiporter
MTLATAIALTWANAAGDSYHRFWAHVIAVPGLRLSAQEWVNQGLMVAFFVLVGLEIRREIAGGELRSWRRASAPIAAALGGMAVPALLYALVLHGRAGSRGWGIPMATDVAFALGALALVASGASTRMRIFLLTLAVADDIASIAILVCFYSRDVKVWNLIGAVGALAVMAALSVWRTRAPLWLMAIGAIAWWALVHAGVEASVVGVAVGLFAAPVAGRVRSRRRAERRRVRSWEHHLGPWVNALVLPLFALANTGVTFSGSHAFSGPALHVFIAVLVARVIGKPLGIAATAWAATRGTQGHGRMHLNARERVGVGSLAAVGFTVPLLIVHAALPAGPLVAAATSALLAGSVLGAVGGAVVLRSPR